MPIDKDTKLGERIKIPHPELVNLYGCCIGDNCTIGAFVEIGKNVIVGNKVKIQSGVFIPEGVTVEDGVFIGPHVCFTNDLYPSATNPDGSFKTENDWEISPIIVRKKAAIGANSTIRGGITIGEGSMIGAGSVVLEDVAAWTIVAGNPAREIGKIDSKTGKKIK